MNSTYSSGRRSVLATNICVQFVSTAPLNLTIKHPMKFKPDETATTAKGDLDEILPRFSGTLQLTESPKKKNGKTHRSFSRMQPQLKNMEFYFEAPMARSVKLAADFTDWGRFPLDMIQSFDGVWWTIVPLLPGKYTYRFIVDDQWCDDPRNVQRVPNPFGTSNAVVSVT